MRRWIGPLVMVLVLLVTVPALLAQGSPVGMPDPVRPLMMGLALMTLTIVGSIFLFMLSGWDEDRRHYRP